MSTFDNYVCDGQMSLFDSLETIPEEEMVSRIGDALGIKFEYRDSLWGWVYKKKGHTLSVHYSRYNFGDHERFIACSDDEKMGGHSGPMDSIEEAIRFFEIDREKWT